MVSNLYPSLFLPSTFWNQTSDSPATTTTHTHTHTHPPLPGRALQAVPGDRAEHSVLGKGQRNRESREKGKARALTSEDPAKGQISAACLGPRSLGHRSETRLRFGSALRKFSERPDTGGGDTWQQVGASQRAGSPPNTIGTGRSLAFSSSGSPRMIREEQGRGGPCVPPESESRTKGERARQHLGGRKAGCSCQGTSPPHSRASSRRWPGGDCMVRARRRVPPAARLLPCRGLRAPADSWGRWRRARDAPGSAPPPRSRTLSPTSGGHRAARSGGRLTASG
jgi:hypothetical protein